MTSPAPPLPFVTAALPAIPGRLRVTPEDFSVDEVPAYLPSGDGEHLYLRVEKRELTTDDALGALARALGVAPRDASAAGRKDKHAVTTQWLSFLGGDPDRARALALPGLRILEVSRHTNKLRTGHLRANRFRIRIRGAADHAEAAARVFETLATTGVPNYFGEQRFGPGDRNVLRARAWLAGDAPAPRNPRDRRFLVSTLQSVVFNRLLAERVSNGELGAYIPGDLLRKEDTGGLFTTEDHEDARARVTAWAVSATGPMVGTRMREPVGEALARERTAMAAEGITDAILSRFGRDGEGTRRVYRVRATEIDVRPEGDDALAVAFTLPTGAYATAVLREVLKRDHADRFENAADAGASAADPDDAPSPA